MTKILSKIALAAAAVAALPGAAQAGTSTTTSNASFNVISQCTVTGKDVQLGTYTASQTWGDVGAALGSTTSNVYTMGSLGQEYLDMGSVTCDAGTPYTLSIKGSAAGFGMVKITHNGKVAEFHTYVKKLGGVAVADNNGLVGSGAQVNSFTLAGTGTGTAQSLIGHANLHFGTGGTTALKTDALGAAGTATDTLNYTLNF